MQFSAKVSVMSARPATAQAPSEIEDRRPPGNFWTSGTRAAPPPAGDGKGGILGRTHKNPSESRSYGSMPACSEVYIGTPSSVETIASSTFTSVLASLAALVLVALLFGTGGTSEGANGQMSTTLAGSTKQVDECERTMLNSVYPLQR